MHFYETIRRVICVMLLYETLSCAKLHSFSCVCCTYISAEVQSVGKHSHVTSLKSASQKSSATKGTAISAFGSITAQMSDGMTIALSQFGESGAAPDGKRWGSGWRRGLLEVVYLEMDSHQCFIRARLFKINNIVS